MIKIDTINQLAIEITDRFKLILDCVPKENDKHLKQFAESAMLFASFIAYLNDIEVK